MLHRSNTNTCLCLDLPISSASLQQSYHSKANVDHTYDVDNNDSRDPKWCNEPLDIANICYDTRVSPSLQKSISSDKSWLYFSPLILAALKMIELVLMIIHLKSIELLNKIISIREYLPHIISQDIDTLIYTGKTIYSNKNNELDQYSIENDIVSSLADNWGQFDELETRDNMDYMRVNKLMTDPFNSLQRARSKKKNLCILEKIEE
mmetsp:Transcript_10560/g.23284  ORF Transcript_10560/g.23284 Transcript_10560/m.23284 type:complete len:207 (-) Transcript_10560:45-665(-)